MELYHGSNVSVEKPKVLSNGHYKDFDMAFIVLILNIRQENGH